LLGRSIALRLASGHLGRNSVIEVRWSIRFSTVWVGFVRIVFDRITEAAIREFAAGHTALGTAADLDLLPISTVCAHL
jgi:hypothetical protein